MLGLGAGMAMGGVAFGVGSGRRLVVFSLGSIFSTTL